MRGLSLIALTVALLLASVVVGHAQFKDNFVMHYTFDTDKADTIKDSSGKNNDGRMFNGVKIAKGQAQYGQCAEFPGGNAYIETVIDVPERNFTMALWINTSTATQGVCSVLDGAAGAGGHDRHFFLVSGNMNFRVWQGVGWNSNAKVADGKWHHVALVTESGAGQIAYLDGEKVGTNAYDHSDFDWQKRVWIGFSNDAAPNYFVGQIDEFAYLDKPLKPADIKSLMKASGIAVKSLGKLASTWGDIKR